MTAEGAAIDIRASRKKHSDLRYIVEAAMSQEETLSGLDRASEFR
jgi:hypothetical protein